jgi:hypothetical protein
MKRLTLYALVDAASFVLCVFMVATGFFLRYALPPGSGGVQGVGEGWRASERPITLVWGLTRHEWGNAHFWIAVALMVVLTLHLALHWRWIVNVIRGQPRAAGAGIRVVLGIVGLLALLTLAAAPFVAPRERLLRGELQMLERPAR